jgi:hypothetical protein
MVCGHLEVEYRYSTQGYGGSKLTSEEEGGDAFVVARGMGWLRMRTREKLCDLSRLFLVYSIWVCIVIVLRTVN